MVEVLFTPKRRPRNRLAALRDPSEGVIRASRR
jgi:hypothetical protein